MNKTGVGPQVLILTERLSLKGYTVNDTLFLTLKLPSTQRHTGDLVAAFQVPMDARTYIYTVFFFFLLLFKLSFDLHLQGKRCFCVS